MYISLYFYLNFKKKKCSVYLRNCPPPNIVKLDGNKRLFNCTMFSGTCKVEEHNGFLKMRCAQDKTGLYTVFKCATSDEFYVDIKDLVISTTFLGFTNITCKNDPKSYQFCGTRDFDKNILAKSDQILCGYTFCKSATSDKLYASFPVSDFKLQYNNGFRCDGNHRHTKEDLIKSQHIDSVPEKLLCDSICDTISCQDESFCNSYTYGFFINISYDLTLYIQPLEICDGRHQYLSIPDEENCNNIEGLDYSNICRRFLTGKIVPIFNSTRCSTIKHRKGPASYMFGLSFWMHSIVCGEHICAPYCSDFKDQTNCTDIKKVAIKCNISQYESSISKMMVCQQDKIGPQMCDDGMDVQCVDTSPSCKVHKHLMCDGTTDCNDNSDELDDACNSMTEKHCFRKYVHKSELKIPLSWLKDGDVDCLDGKDENMGIWPTCGFGKTQHFVSQETNCSDVYICQHEKETFIELKNLCDGIETCGNENKICQITHNKPFLYEKLQKSYGDNKHKSALYCVKGLWNQERLLNQCLKVPVKIFDNEIFGFKENILELPDKTLNCQFMYGEVYLYLSCLGYCKVSKCPLPTIRKPLRHDSCPGQYHQRIYTLVNNSALTFAVRKHGTYVNDNFICNNSFCIDYSNVCNLVDDCGDASDEQLCKNHFSCTKNKQFLPINQKCDTTVHCLDFSDECNEDCSKNILSGILYKFSAWAIGCIATFSNAGSLINSLTKLKECKTFNNLSNKTMIILICMGDFFVGVYLLLIAMIDSLVYNNTFCYYQFAWLTNTWCSFLGSLNTFGSQLSIFSMTALSLLRAVGIKYSMITPEPTTRINSTNLCFFVISLILWSGAIALTPLVDCFEDYFVNGLVYDHSIGLFIGMVDKKTHFNALQAYYGRMQDKPLKWTLITEMMHSLFTHDYNLASGFHQKVHFYGNDGVCLFKYFVKKNDPQRGYTLALLFLNIFCFIIISICYLYIGLSTVNGSRILVKSPGPTGKQVRARNKKMQQRIIFLIATDFICWVPFVVVCYLHFSDLIDATPMYSTFSIIVLPINSVINPLLNDEKHMIVVIRDILLGTILKIHIGIYKVWKMFITRKKQHTINDINMTSFNKSPATTQEIYHSEVQMSI